MKWHKVEPECPECNTPFTIMAVYSAADGEIMFDGVCVLCNLFMDFKTTGAKLVARSVKRDIKEAKLEMSFQKGTDDIQ